jgi:prevent-host-death family protein
MATTMTVSEARAALHELLERVRVGEEVTLTRHGRPVAVVLRPDMLRARSATGALDAAARVGALLSSARQSSSRLADGAISSARAEELVAAVRAARRRP